MLLILPKNTSLRDISTIVIKWQLKALIKEIMCFTFAMTINYSFDFMELYDTILNITYNSATVASTILLKEPERTEGRVHFSRLLTFVKFPVFTLTFSAQTAGGAATIHVTIHLSARLSVALSRKGAHPSWSDVGTPFPCFQSDGRNVSCWLFYNVRRM